MARDLLKTPQILAGNSSPLLSSRSHTASRQRTARSSNRLITAQTMSILPRGMGNGCRHRDVDKEEEEHTCFFVQILSKSKK